MAERDARHHEKDTASRLILSPSLLFLLLFTRFPLGRSVYDSLFDTRMASDGAQYVGLDNFTRLFADNVFWQSLGNNLLYILLTVVPGVTLALLLAVALSENHRVNRWLRTAFFFPMIIRWSAPPRCGCLSLCPASACSTTIWQSCSGR